jgi:hypothetical protein
MNARPKNLKGVEEYLVEMTRIRAASVCRMEERTIRH